MKNGDVCILLPVTMGAECLKRPWKSSLFWILKPKILMGRAAGRCGRMLRCFGYKNHTVYFSCFGNYYTGNDVEKDKEGSPITRSLPGKI